MQRNTMRAPEMMQQRPSQIAKLRGAPMGIVGAAPELLQAKQAAETVEADVVEAEEVTIASPAGYDPDIEYTERREAEALEEARIAAILHKFPNYRDPDGKDTRVRQMVRDFPSLANELMTDNPTTAPSPVDDGPAKKVVEQIVEKAAEKDAVAEAQRAACEKIAANDPANSWRFKE